MFTLSCWAILYSMGKNDPVPNTRWKEICKECVFPPVSHNISINILCAIVHMYVEIIMQYSYVATYSCWNDILSTSKLTV